MTDPSLTVIVPAYNEKQNISRVVAEAIEMLEDLPLRDYEVLLVDDGSTDSTSDEADALARSHPRVRALHHGRNRRQGAAFLTGWANATCEYVSWLAGDGQNPPECLRTLLEGMGRGDLAVSRYVDRNYPMGRQVLTAGRTTMIRLLFGRVPWSQGPMMVRRDSLRGLRLLSDSGFIHVEIAVREVRRGSTIVEVGVPYRSRLSGVSKGTNLRHVLHVTTDMLRVRLSLWRARSRTT